MSFAHPGEDNQIKQRMIRWLDTCSQNRFAERSAFLKQLSRYTLIVENRAIAMTTTGYGSPVNLRACKVKPGHEGN